MVIWLFILFNFEEAHVQVNLACDMCPHVFFTLLMECSLTVIDFEQAHVQVSVACGLCPHEFFTLLIGCSLTVIDLVLNKLTRSPQHMTHLVYTWVIDMVYAHVHCS